MLLEFVDSLFEAVEVEFVFDEILVDFAEEAVIFKATEPLDPADVDIFAKLGLLAHQILIFDSKFKYTSKGVIVFYFLVHLIADRHSPYLLIESLILDGRIDVTSFFFLLLLLLLLFLLSFFCSS